MATELRWNVRERAEREAQALPAAQQRQREEDQRRRELRAQLPFWRAQLAAHQEALPRWQEEARNRRRAQDEALLAYREALYRETGGELPRASSGQLIEVIDMGPDAHPEAVAARPARFQWEAFKQAEQEALHAAGVVRKLEAALPELRAWVTECEQAGVR